MTFFQFHVCGHSLGNNKYAILDVRNNVPNYQVWKSCFSTLEYKIICISVYVYKSMPSSSSKMVFLMYIFG
jgi:hypothetical protein